MSSAGCAVGSAVIPCWRSMRTKAVAWSRVAGIDVSLLSWVQQGTLVRRQSRADATVGVSRAVRSEMSLTASRLSTVSSMALWRAEEITASQAAVLVHDVGIT